METIKLKNGKVLEIHFDKYPNNPIEEDDTMMTMYCFHKRYALGHKHNIDPGNYSGWSEMEKENFNEKDIVIPLYLYDHGALSISTTPFHCPWDSGQIGFAVITVETIIREYDKDTPENRVKALKILTSEVETYDNYLQGQVFGFVLKKGNKEIDSCWGFYGNDHIKSGLYETAGVKTEDILNSE